MTRSALLTEALSALAAVAMGLGFLACLLAVEDEDSRSGPEVWPETETDIQSKEATIYVAKTATVGASTDTAENAKESLPGGYERTGAPGAIEDGAAWKAAEWAPVTRDGESQDDTVTAAESAVDFSADSSGSRTPCGLRVDRRNQPAETPCNSAERAPFADALRGPRARPWERGSRVSTGRRLSPSCRGNSAGPCRRACRGTRRVCPAALSFIAAA